MLSCDITQNMILMLTITSLYAKGNTLCIQYKWKKNVDVLKKVNTPIILT